MSSRPLCYRCNEYMCLGGCRCKNPAFSNDEIERECGKQVIGTHGDYWFCELKKEHEDICR